MSGKRWELHLNTEIFKMHRSWKCLYFGTSGEKNSKEDLVNWEDPILSYNVEQLLLFSLQTSRSLLSGENAKILTWRRPIWIDSLGTVTRTGRFSNHRLTRKRNAESSSPLHSLAGKMPAVIYHAWGENSFSAASDKSNRKDWKVLWVHSLNFVTHFTRKLKFNKIMLLIRAFNEESQLYAESLYCGS